MTRVFLLVGLILFSVSALAVSITTVPQNIATNFKIDTKFYRKYLSVSGIPVVTPARVSNRALLKTGHIIQRMLAPNDLGNTLAGHIVKYRGRVGIVPIGEHFSVMPELSGKKRHDGSAGVALAKWRWRRARGVTSYEYIYNMAITREQNALELGWPTDRAWGTSTVIHEFAHLLDQSAFKHELPHIRRAIEKAYTKAMRAGKYRGAYAATNYLEYWAERGRYVGS